MRYLDPKTDLTFKRVFGEHADLLKSLLNSLLPFNTEETMIDTLEYLPAEQVPDNPLKKDSILWVNCRNKTGQMFIVEILIIWSKMFMQRVQFSAPKLCMKQFGRSENFKLQQPMYALALVNEIFEPDNDQCIHNYALVEMEDTRKVIDGFHFTLVELPKFRHHAIKDKDTAVLWMYYLMEIHDKTETVPQELLDFAETHKAIEFVEQCSYTNAQIEWYDEFWDAVRVEKTLVNSSLRKGEAIGMEKGRELGRKEGMELGRKEGIKQGLEEGRKEGLEAGRKESARAIARQMKDMGMSVEDIARITGLPANEI